MPYDIGVEQNQLSHTGTFSRPLFELWGEGRTVLGRLYDAFSPHGATLSSIRVESPSASPSDEAVVVSLGPRIVHRFRYDRIETSIFNFSDEEVNRFRLLVQASTEWIRSSVPTFRFGSHLFTYAGHARLADCPVEKLLKGLGREAPKRGGVDRGTGVVFHWEVPAGKWRTQLVLDHSLVLSGGLFIMFTLSVEADEVDYGKLTGEGRTYLDGVLEELGLRFARPR